MRIKLIIGIYIIAVLLQLPAISAAAQSFNRRVLCGGEALYTDSHGYIWAPDQAYAGSPDEYQWGYLTTCIASHFPGERLENTYDWPLYQNERWAAAGETPAYRFDVSGPGKYYVKILLAEMYFGVTQTEGIGNGIGQRVFDLYINGEEKLDNYDNLADTNGRAARAIVKSFEIEVSDSGDYANTIIITTQAQVENPKLNAIEISDIPTLTDTMDAYSQCSPSDEEVYRMNCGGTKSLETDGTLWMADEAYALCQRWGYVNGSAKINTHNSWAEPSDYCQATWREGETDFKYLFSLPKGQYNVKLLFVENEYDADGMRVFNVNLNGASVAAQLDVHARVGKENPYEISRLVTVSEERLEITFPAIQSGQAMISAIEILVLSVSDDDFLDFVERRSLDYFINHTPPFRTVNPANGLIIDRKNNFISTAWQAPSSVAGVGFGLAAVCAGKERGWISAPEAEQQITTTLDFFHKAVPYGDGTEDQVMHQNGFFFHILQMSNGKRDGDSELSSADSALLLAGIITAKQTFPGTLIESLAGAILERVNWNWFVNNNENGFVHMQWKPEGEPDAGFTGLWSEYNEGMIIDILGLGSSTHPLLPSCWFNTGHYWWEENEVIYMGEKPPWGPLGLFVHIFPQCFADLRNLQDDKNDYFFNTGQAVAANRKFCQEQSQYKTYAKGGWGISASDSPIGGYSYTAYAPRAGAHDGTVSPSIMGASVPFAPHIAIPALRRTYFRYKHFLWGRFGFADAYNLDAPMTLDKYASSGMGWVASDAIGLDIGCMILGLENYRTGLIWSKFKLDASIPTALTRIGMNSQIIDDFENDLSYHDAEHERDAQWWASNTEVYTFSTAKDIAGNTTTCLKITYNKETGEEWSYISLSELDQNANMSYYLASPSLSWQVRGSVEMMLKFKDIEGSESRNSEIFTIESPEAWQTVAWNYANLDWNQSNPREIQEILLFVQPGKQGSGEFYIDNITLGEPGVPPSPTPAATPTLDIPAGVANTKEIFSYPNPARDQVEFLYYITGEAVVYVDIYNISGARVASIREERNGGNGQVMKTTWLTNRVAPGVYLCRFIIKNKAYENINSQIKKIAIIR